MSIQTFQGTERGGRGRRAVGRGRSFRALNRASPSETERVQPTPDTLVSVPLCSLCSKRLQTRCAGAVNLRDGFVVKRKRGKKMKEKRARHRTERGCVRCDGWTGSGGRAMWDGARWDSRRGGGDKGSRCLLDTDQGG